MVVSIILRSVLVAALMIGLGISGVGCDDDDREPNRIDVVLAPGESATFTFQVTVDESEEADFLVSCDFVDIIEIDSYNLVAWAEDPGRSGARECAAHITITTFSDTEPGEYQIRVRFDYTFFAGGIGEDDTDGYIQVLVVS